MAERKVCAISGCEKPAFARGWCAGHYHRWRKHGSTDGGRHTHQGCAVAGCDRRHKAKGYCADHYDAFRRRGDALAKTERTPPGALLAWLEAHKNHQGDDCLPWPFACYPHGYGHISYEGTETSAHRVMCALAHGEPPESELEAAHSCNNRPCCNPRHLRWATKPENMADMAAWGSNAGERNGAAKLSSDDVRMIRRLRGTVGQAELGEQFGVTKSTISYIQLGKGWRHIR